MRTISAAQEAVLASAGRSRSEHMRVKVASVTGGTGAVVGTITSAASVTAYLCDFDVSVIGGTAAVGPITVAGLLGGSITTKRNVQFLDKLPMVLQNFLIVRNRCHSSPRLLALDLVCASAAIMRPNIPVLKIGRYDAGAAVACASMFGSEFLRHIIPSHAVFTAVDPSRTSFSAITIRSSSAPVR